MASIKEEGTRGKRLSYKIRVCLGRDENGRQILKAMRWNPPEDMTPAKAWKEAQRVAAGCFINVAAIQIHHSKRCLHFLFHADDEMVKQNVLLDIRHFCVQFPHKSIFKIIVFLSFYIYYIKY